MAEYKGSAQEKADKKYRDSIKSDEEKRLDRNKKSYFRSAKSFVEKANAYELNQLQALIDERRKDYPYAAEREQYIFSNDPQPPALKLELEDFVRLSTQLSPEVAIVPYLQNSDKLDDYKAAFPDYQFIHVYRFTGQSPADERIDPTAFKALYQHGHKEFNIPGERKWC